MRFSRNWIAAYVDLPEDRQTLASALSMLGLVVDDMREAAGDLILDLDIPSNRPDVMNHLAIARELALALGRDLRPPGGAVAGDGQPTEKVAAVQIEDPDGCPRFMARALFDVRVTESPAWLCERLEAIGLRPINNVVDVTNFVMWEMGRPMHAYDLDRLAGHRLVVRRASAGERLTTLDEQERVLTDQDLVIADADRVVGLAGVMGGADTGVTGSTHTVLLECACFDPVTIRRMARHHGMHTDASHRFERGLSTQDIAAATCRAASLLADIAQARVSAEPLDVRGSESEARLQLSLSPQRVTGYLGVEVDDGDIERIFTHLGFGFTALDDVWQITVPPRRTDVSRPVDLIEEIARFYGYDRLPSTLPLLRRPDKHGPVPVLRDERRIREVCAALGFWEAMTFVFTSESQQRRFLPEDAAVVSLSNPLSEAMGVLRRSLAPGLLAAVARNLNHGAERVRLFELGRAFVPGPEGQAPDERRTLALVACGSRNPNHHLAPAQPLSFLDLKGTVQTLAARLGWPDPVWEPATPPGYQRGVAARVRLGEHAGGMVGKVDPAVADTWGIAVPLWLAHLDVHELLGQPRPDLRVRPLPRFPASRRDLSVLVPVDVTFEQIRQAILAHSNPALLASHDLLEVYRGDDLPPGHVSLTLRLTYRAAERTLTAEEIESAHETLVKGLERSVGARRR